MSDVKFRIRADATFEADDIDAARGVLAAHLINSEAVDVLEKGYISIHPDPHENYPGLRPRGWASAAQERING